MSRVRFLGRSTRGSLVHRVFPAWMAALGLDVTLEAVDLPAETPREDYRRFVDELHEDPELIGAVITSHKLGVHAAARDLLTPGDPYVDLLGEVNAIAAGAMTAHARDVMAVAAVLPAFGPLRQALVLGAGGAGTAIVLALVDAGVHVAVTDVRIDRLEALRHA